MCTRHEVRRIRFEGFHVPGFRRNNTEGRPASQTSVVGDDDPIRPGRHPFRDISDLARRTLHSRFTDGNQLTRLSEGGCANPQHAIHHDGIARVIHICKLRCQTQGYRIKNVNASSIEGVDQRHQPQIVFQHALHKPGTGRGARHLLRGWIIECEGSILVGEIAPIGHNNGRGRGSALIVITSQHIASG